MDKYHHLDARKIGTILEPDSVQTTITSPPYFDSKNYEGTPCQIGWKQTYKDYLSDVKSVFKSCFDSTRRDGTLWIVVDTYRREGLLKLLPLKIMEVLEDIGWIPQDVVIWDKVKNLPYSRRGQFRDNFEYILLFSKTSDFKYHIDRIREMDTLEKWWIRYPERYHPCGKDPSNIWRIAIPSQGSWSNGNIQHLCPFPPLLVERIVRLSTDEGDLVFDPFAGSGLVLAQAKCMNRRFIGCDINKKYRTRFYKKVLPEVEAQWGDQVAKIASLEKRREEFGKTIMSLRKLKFAKILVKRFGEKFGENSVSFAKALSGKNPNGNVVRFTLYTSDSYSQTMEDAKQWLEREVVRQPLSNFGLKPSVKARLVKIPDVSFRKGLGKYHFYPNGKFYDFAEVEDPSSIANADDHDFPPILSNLRVSMVEIRDLFQERSLKT